MQISYRTYNSYHWSSISLPNITKHNNKIHNAISEVSKRDCIIMGDVNHWRIQRGLRDATPPPLIFKRGVTSVAVVIGTVSTVSEQERNGRGRRQVGKSVHVRQAIVQLDAYHVRRGFV